MKKVLSLLLVLLLALSCATALAAEQNVYNFKDTEGETLVNINVVGYYLWTVPAETEICFTGKTPSKANAFGSVTIENVVFNKFDETLQGDLTGDKGLGADMYIYVCVDDAKFPDLVCKAALYEKDAQYITEAEYNALSEKTGWKSVEKFDELDQTVKDKYTSIISKTQWQLYQEYPVSKKNGEGKYVLDASDTKFIAVNADSALKTKGITSKQPVVAVRTMKDGTVKQIKSVRVEGEDTAQDCNQYNDYTPSAEDAASFNKLVYSSLVEGVASNDLYFTCFGTPTLLGVHTGNVTYQSGVLSIENLSHG